MDKLSGIRKEYVSGSLERHDLDSDPMIQFSKWMNDAIELGEVEPTAMSLATVDVHHIPYVRIVLLKDINEAGLVFFTNYKSNKGLQIEQNSFVAVCFYWPKIERQVRFVGKVSKTTSAISDKYFRERPKNSRIGAWISPQSRVISDDWIALRFDDCKSMSDEECLIRPPHWGGYLIKPFEVEFWQGRASRLHDRFVYKRNQEGEWTVDRLAP